jgi:hypothetical protein
MVSMSFSHGGKIKVPTHLKRHPKQEEKLHTKKEKDGVRISNTKPNLTILLVGLEFVNFY